MGQRKKGKKTMEVQRGRAGTVVGVEKYRAAKLKNFESCEILLIRGVAPTLWRGVVKADKESGNITSLYTPAWLCGSGGRPSRKGGRGRNK